MSESRAIRHVAYFSPEWPPEHSTNGITTYTAVMGRALADRGVSIRIVAGRLASALPGRDVSVLDGPTRSRLPRLGRALEHRIRGRRAPTARRERRLLKHVRRLHRDWRVDLFEVEESFGFARRTVRDASVPTVVRLHGPWFLNGAALGETGDPLYGWRVERERELIEMAHALSAPSQDVLDRVRKHFEIELPGAAVIPNPGPPLDGMTPWRQACAEPETVLFVGRFDRMKGGDLVVDAFRSIAARRPNARLLFVGPDRGFRTESGRIWSLRDYLLERTPAELRSRIRCLGALPTASVAALRSRAAVAIVASRYEVFPMTAIEALAAGSPLVAPCVGGLSEILSPGRNALCFRAGDAEDLARQVLELLRRPELAVRIGEAGRRDYERRYAPSVVAAATLEFYAEVRERFASQRR